VVASDQDDDPVAAALEAEKRWLDLVKHLTKQVDTAPAGARAALYLRIATLYHDRFANLAEAIKAYERVLEHEPDNRVAIDHLRAVYEKRRDWEKLLELEKGDLERTAPDQRADKAVEIARFAAARVGKPDVTIYWWQRVLDHEPDHRRALAELAKSFERAERPAELATVLARQVDLAQGNDDRIEALRRLATVREEQLGDRDAARAAWREVLDVDPSDADAKRALARLDTGTPRDDSTSRDPSDEPTPRRQAGPSDPPGATRRPPAATTIAIAIAIAALAVAGIAVYWFSR
jgi:tetratricopeptide (TPR) repeat protein